MMNNMRMFIWISAAIAAFHGNVFADGMEQQLQGKLTIFMVSISVAMLVLLYLVLRSFSTYRKRGSKKLKDEDTRIEFMVGTFHELVQKLKEKEAELNDLRMKAENRVGDIESYNENILQSVPSGVVSFDKNQTITHMNASAEKILGISSQEGMNRAFGEVFPENISTIIRDNTYLERGEVVYETPSKKRVWLGLNISPLKDREGNPIGKIIIFTDLTDLKAMESQMKLRENLSTLGEMSAGIAHELRNPMGVIAGYTKMLQRKVPDELQSAVDAIDREIRMMDRIISDFMSFTHPLSVEKSPINLKGLVDDASDNVLAECEGLDVDLRVGDSVSVLADETLLRQVVTNLLQNAADAMGGQGKIVITAESDVNMTKLSVRDTGHGMSSDVEKKIFLPFYTTKVNGTGLGLAIVHKIVVSHGGNVGFETGPDGTVFHVTLPAQG